MKYLKGLMLPAVVLLAAVGVVLPILEAVQEERCQVFHAAVIEADLLGIGSADEILEQHPDQTAYLLKHPLKLLRICLAAEPELATDQQRRLNRLLAAAAYESLTDRALDESPESIRETLSRQDPKLSKKLAE